MVKRPDAGEAGTTASQYEQEQIREWTTYRAVTPIDYRGVRAYNAGDPVPVSAVEGESAWVFDDLVERVDGTDSGTTAAPEPTTQTAAADSGSTTQEA